MMFTNEDIALLAHKLTDNSGVSDVTFSFILLKEEDI